MKLTSALCGQNVERLHVKIRCKHSNNYALKD